MNPADIPQAVILWLLAQPAFITVVVNWLKSNPWIGSHPRETAAILNFLATTVLGSLLYMTVPATLRDPLSGLLTAVATGLTQGLLSTGLYEWIKPKTF